MKTCDIRWFFLQSQIYRFKFTRENEGECPENLGHTKVEHGEVINYVMKNLRIKSGSMQQVIKIYCVPLERSGLITNQLAQESKAGSLVYVLTYSYVYIS